ncbi:hypothetical protein BXY41_11568 [Lacrimispora xylanisolvens]|uniref:Uncharacterized protein n=1 Tax=Lacrimispora xylanisolvens TaxID=384636 RepID=A0A2S6HLM8_9FIRM|nr:hypothetical protein BXY41_11568 [Hungatella xylanolytica]
MAVAPLIMAIGLCGFNMIWYKYYKLVMNYKNNK